MWRGRYRAADGTFTLRAYGDADDDDKPLNGAAEAASGPAGAGGNELLSEDAMLAELQGDADALPRLSAVQDDYDWWKARGYNPSSGKPLWLTLEPDHIEWRHIFFDDNIHHDANDSIVAVRARRAAGSPFTPVSGEATIELHGSVLKKVPTVRPILDHAWFIDQISLCEQRFEALRDGTASGSNLAKLLGL